MVYQRDPISELFDDGARRLLERAYASPGQWAGTRLRNPQARHTEAFAGIDLLGPDTVRGREAKTRWARGFVRALYYQHKHYSPTASGRGWSRRSVSRESGGLVVEVGRALPGGRQAGTVLGPGRAVRVRLMRGGQAKAAAVARKPEARIWADKGPAWADPGDRDW